MISLAPDHLLYFHIPVFPFLRLRRPPVITSDSESSSLRVYQCSGTADIESTCHQVTIFERLYELRIIYYCHFTAEIKS